MYIFTIVQRFTILRTIDKFVWGRGRGVKLNTAYIPILYIIIYCLCGSRTIKTVSSNPK